MSWDTTQKIPEDIMKGMDNNNKYGCAGRICYNSRSY